LFGSAFATVLVGLAGNRFVPGFLLRFVATLTMATGLAFVGLSSLWPLLIVTFVGTLNPSSGDVNLFLPLAGTVTASAQATTRVLQNDGTGSYKLATRLPLPVPSLPSGHASLRSLT
jgi:hypothetical protein